MQKLSGYLLVSVFEKIQRHFGLKFNEKFCGFYKKLLFTRLPEIKQKLTETLLEKN